MSVRMKIRVEVEVPVGLWSDDTSFQQVREQVKNEGVNIVRAAAEKLGWRVTGAPRVVAMVMEEEKGGA